jgi:hypothetical protein
MNMSDANIQLLIVQAFVSSSSKSIQHTISYFENYYDYLNSKVPNFIEVFYQQFLYCSKENTVLLYNLIFKFLLLKSKSGDESFKTEMLFKSLRENYVNDFRVFVIIILSLVNYIDTINSYWKSSFNSGFKFFSSKVAK